MRLLRELFLLLSFHPEDIDILGVEDGTELLENMTEQGLNYFTEAESDSGGVNSARGDVGAYNIRNMGVGNTLILT